MEVTELLVPNAVSAVNVSPAYLFRKVGSEDGTPTILFDEIDTVFGPNAKENEEIRGLLNAGHRRNAVAGRCVARGSVIMTEEIPAYAAVALAGLGWLPDTILSRSVIIRMRRRHQDERVQQFRHRIEAPRGERLRKKIELWARSLGEISWPQLPPEVQDRDADVWEPLIAVADATGGQWPERARTSAVALIMESKEVEPSLGIRLLADSKTVFGSAEKMSSKDVLAALHALEESPWADFKGKPLNERGLASRLKQYGITSKVIRFDAKQARGYLRADLQDAWERYLSPSPDRSVTSVPSVTSIDFTKKNGSEQRSACVTASVPSVPASGEMTAHVTLVTQDVTDRDQKNLNNINDVTLVTPVTHFQEDGENRCVLCGCPGHTVECHYAGITALLHRECIEQWRTNMDDGLDIPTFLRRS
jgi:hypothetical protein